MENFSFRVCTASGQRNDNTGSRSTGNGLLGNPTAGTIGGGGGIMGGRSTSFSTLGGSSLSDSNGGGSRIGPIPEGDVCPPVYFAAPILQFHVRL